MKVLFRKIINYLEYTKRKRTFGKLGTNVTISIGFNVSLPENIYIHDNVYIGNNAWISSYNSVILHSGVIIGPRVKIYTGNHNYNSDISIPYDAKTIAKKVIINENVWIGGDVIILPGVEIGEGAVIGAGSVVTKNVEPYFVMGGNPAKKIKERDKDLYLKLKSENKIYLKLKKQGILKPYVDKI